MLHAKSRRSCDQTRAARGLNCHAEQTASKNRGCICRGSRDRRRRARPSTEPICRTTTGRCSARGDIGAAGPRTISHRCVGWMGKVERECAGAGRERILRTHACADGHAKPGVVHEHPPLPTPFTSLCTSRADLAAPGENMTPLSSVVSRSAPCFNGNPLARRAVGGARVVRPRRLPRRGRVPSGASAAPTTRTLAQRAACDVYCPCRPRELRSMSSGARLGPRR